MTTSQLQKLLVGAGLVDTTLFQETAKRAREQGQALSDALIDAGLVRDDQLGKLLAELQGFSFLDVTRERIDDDIFRMIPEDMARAAGVVAIGERNGAVKVAMVDPAQTDTIYALERVFGKPIEVYATTARGLRTALKRYKNDLKALFGEITDALTSMSTREERDAVVTKTVDVLLNAGQRARASDIHLEPQKEHVQVRFRIDGVLQAMLILPTPLYDSILSRIKILSRMRTDEHRAAQDGKFRFTSEDDGKDVDVRVSVVPTSYGENIVMRLLSSSARQFGLPELGLRGADLEKVHRNIAEPHGMILVTGPTGSGKTTTLYAVLKLLNRSTVNIATIEDPVEYDIQGVTQIQVDNKTNLTFAKGLRAIVRQDPDIIMVGEIRDEETAGIAINSALTGHLVLSTLHTNDAPTTLPRLLDMGIEPFLVSSTMNIIIAQRLVRRLCPSCVTSYRLDGNESGQDMILHNETLVQHIERMSGHAIDELRLYKGTGCSVCGGTGYSGRIGIFEVLEMTDDIRRAVMKQEHADSIREKAIAAGMRTMLEDGIAKAVNGLTTIEEVLRVALV